MQFLIPAILFTMALATSTPKPLGPLHWDVYLVPEIPVYVPGTNLTWSRTAITLIHGASTAILVDAPITVSATNALADWISRTIPGKKLTHNFLTHGHGDHFFGAPVLQQRFPGLEVIATKEVIAHAEDQLVPTTFKDFWEKYFPGQIAPQTQTFTALPPNGIFELEGHLLKAVPLGQTDTYNTTVLHVPDLDMVVTGDAVYGEYFQYLAESTTPALRDHWIRAIDEIEAWKPKIVIPSHKQEWDGFGMDHLEKTKRYLKTWGEEILRATSKDDLKNKIIAKFPKRRGDFILEISAEAAFPSV